MRQRAYAATRSGGLAMAEVIAVPQKSAQGTVTPEGTLVVHEPGSGKLLGEVRVSTPADVRYIVQQARAAQSEWARKPFAARRAVLMRFKELLLERAEAFCDHLTRENGKTRNESLFMEVLPVADAVHWYATHAEKALADERIPLHLFPHKKSYLRFYPRGVIGIISPWNYPFSIPLGDALAALMAGNAVVVKPSEFTPIILEKARSLFEEAGLPRGLFGLVQGKGDVGAELICSGVKIVRRHLDEARQRGAKVLAGGGIEVTPEGARFVQPTVLTDTTPDMAIVREETFGPMLPIMTFRTEEEAVRLANDSSYGLSAYVFTKDRARAERLANQLAAGTVMHNDTLYTHAAPETPWGGVKASGLGRVHGKHALRDFSEVRHVNLERLNFPAFWYYPYSKSAWSTGLRVYRTLLGRGITGRLKALFGKH